MAIMRVVIMGASKLGVTIAKTMASAGYGIVIIDLEQEPLDHLPETLEAQKIVGSGTDPEILKKIDLKPEDIFVAASTSDNVNIAAIKMVKEQFKCQKTGKVIHDSLRAQAYNEVEKGIICPILDAALRFKDYAVS